jgi:hypothetical protein
MACYVYTTHSIGFLLSRSFVLTTSIKVGICITKNENPKPLTVNSADPVKISIADITTQTEQKNEA